MRVTAVTGSGAPAAAARASPSSTATTSRPVRDDRKRPLRLSTGEAALAPAVRRPRAGEPRRRPGPSTSRRAGSRPRSRRRRRGPPGPRASARRCGHASANPGCSGRSATGVERHPLERGALGVRDRDRQRRRGVRRDRRVGPDVHVEPDREARPQQRRFDPGLLARLAERAVDRGLPHVPGAARQAPGAAEVAPRHAVLQQDASSGVTASRPEAPASPQKRRPSGSSTQPSPLPRGRCGGTVDMLLTVGAAG